MNKLVTTLNVVAVAGVIFFSCRPSTSQESVKFQQYFAQGEQLYSLRCSNCHQKSGHGLGLVYPPLDKSDYVEKNLGQVICTMKGGMKGEIIVNGKNYNQPMPGVPTLTDLEMAELATYLYNTWGRTRGIIDVEEVGKSLEKCVN